MKKELKNIQTFEQHIDKNLDISVMYNKIMENSNEQKNKIENLKDLLELVSDVDIMFHEERKEYFFEWMKDDKFITVWLGDYV
jgi:hypothetical protein